ncbi:MAG: segregation/condensation protein A, partial [Planctomycetota bacterium]
MTDGDQAVLEHAQDEIQSQPETDAQTQEANEPDLGYRVEIEAFSGPLDLLLYLVRRAEVDIWDIPIATITDQFIDTIRKWEEMDLDLAGDFILMAATLLEIKSRAIVPVEENEASEDEDELIDPRIDLVRQLLAFRACKDWAERLDACEQLQLQRHGRRYHEDIPDAPEDEDGCDLENADPYQLFRVWDRILADIAGKGALVTRANFGCGSSRE